MDDKKVVHEEDNENPEKKALVPETDKEKEDTEQNTSIYTHQNRI